MYKGALLPGLVLTGLYVAYVFGITLVKPAAAPGAAAARPHVTRHGAGAARAAVSMLPPLILIFLVLGTIFLGIATPTEGGALGAVGALVLTALHRKLDFTPAQTGHGFGP